MSYMDTIAMLGNLPWYCYLIIIHCILSVIISRVMYLRIRKFFPNDKKPGKHVLGDCENQEELLSDEINDDANPEFKRRDIAYLSYGRIFFGTVSCLVYTRFFLFFAFLIFNSILFLIANVFTMCTKKPEIPRTSVYKRLLVKLILYVSMFPIQIMAGFITNFTRLENENVRNVYSKYLGENYDISKRDKFSMYISNHHGWMEALYWVIHITPGFIAKKELASIPFIGLLLNNIDCLLVNRKDKENRHKTAEEMKIRQELYMNGETSAPLLIYPEGTVTAGKFVLEFKKGAFMHLLPLKPLATIINEDGPGTYLCPLPFFEHMFYIYSFIWHYSKFYELPVIEYNHHMKVNFKKEDELDEDTYTRVANHIYQEIFEMKFSTKTFKELDAYEIYKSKSS